MKDVKLLALNLVFISRYSSTCSVKEQLCANNRIFKDLKYLAKNMSTHSSSSVVWNGSNIKFLNQKEATDIDLQLFEDYKFSVDQLMELAGQSCAHAISKEFKPDKEKKVLICAGPGNNGGDGLVCSRHLKLLGFDPVIYYPKPVDKPLFHNLIHQSKMFDVSFLDKFPSMDELERDYSVIVDAIFGFSFKPPVRPLFVPIMNAISKTQVSIVSIDIPSGWDVETGPSSSEFNISPEMLISLTAPKMCANFFTGKFHYLGGRFVPPKLQNQYELNLPEYPANDQVYRLK